MSAPLRKVPRDHAGAAWLLGASSLLLALGSCVAAPPVGASRGIVYTHVVRPLDIREHDTRVADLPAKKDDLKHFSYSVVNFIWGDTGVGEMARAAGFEEVLYADLETQSYFGIWTRRWVHVYGR
jgi:hypothetical protein